MAACPARIHRPRLPALLALGLALLAPPGPPALEAAPEAAHPHRLHNGMEVIVTPAPDCPRAAIVLVLRVGERHDPPGKSGLTHLCEHLFVTSPAGEAPATAPVGPPPTSPVEGAPPARRIEARRAEELAARYPEGHTAQTSDGYVTIGMVFPAERLEEELEELALRLGALDIRAEDLERERARVLLEVGNMFEGLPPLAAFNRAREIVLPTPEGGRRAGLPAHVSALTLEEVRAHAARAFRAGNAVLSLAGPVEPAKAIATLEARFGALPAGERPTATVRAPAVTGPRMEVLAAPPGAATPPRLTLAYAAPAPDHADYPAFVLLAARLFDGRGADRTFPPPFYFAPLDEPGACYVSALLEPDEAPEAAVARVQKRVNATVSAPLGPADVLRATNLYGLLLGLVPTPQKLQPFALYPVAMGRAVRHVLGLDPGRLQKAFAQVRTLPGTDVAARVFDPLASGAAVITAPAR